MFSYNPALTMNNRKNSSSYRNTGKIIVIVELFYFLLRKKYFTDYILKR
jgi:hypothetical protein